MYFDSKTRKELWICIHKNAVQFFLFVQAKSRWFQAIFSKRVLLHESEHFWIDAITLNVKNLFKLYLGWYFQNHLHGIDPDQICGAQHCKETVEIFEISEDFRHFFQILIQTEKSIRDIKIVNSKIFCCVWF